jgi:hypothetical protein
VLINTFLPTGKPNGIILFSPFSGTEFSGVDLSLHQIIKLNPPPKTGLCKFKASFAFPSK